MGILIQPGGLMAAAGAVRAAATACSRGTAALRPVGDAVEAGDGARLADGWTAVGCSVTHRPVAGHRVDKGQDGGRVRTGEVVFAQPPGRSGAILWSVTAPAPIGSFALTRRSPSNAAKAQCGEGLMRPGFLLTPQRKKMKVARMKHGMSTAPDHSM